MKVEDESVAVMLFAASKDTPKIVYPILMPELRRLRLEAETVRAIALSLSAAKDICVLRVDRNADW